jgi:hypothetical protein
MSRHYNVFTEIDLMHDYYAEGSCGDVVVQPTAETAALLPKYRLRWGSLRKQRASSFQLLREQIDASTPLVDLPVNYLLRFEMALTNEAFLNFTDIPRKSSREIFLFGNQATGTSLRGPAYEKLELVGDAAHIEGLTGATTVTAVPVAGGASVTAVAFQQAGAWVARLNLERAPIGVFDLTWSVASVPFAKRIYHDPGLLGKGLFGILHLQQGNTLTIGSSYVQAFKARKTTWKYYVLFKGPSDLGINFVIEHPSLNFNRSAFNYPSLSDVATGDLALDTAMLVSNIKVAARFESTTQVSYQDVARSFIALRRSAGTGPGIVVKHLPNPALGDPNAAVIVIVDPPLP